MKKFLFNILFIVISISVYSQNLDSLASIYSKVENVEYNLIEDSMLKAGITEVKDSIEQAMVEKFEAVEVLTLEKCTDDVKENFSKQVSEVLKTDYEPLVNVKNDGQKVTISLKKVPNGQIAELVIFIYEVPMYVRIKGDFSESDIDQLIEKSSFN